jgi:hypothetical protein
MTNDEQDQILPLADPEREEIAGQVFDGWATMCPEEWAARFSHTIGCSSFDMYQYRNPKLHVWIHRLHQILSETPPPQVLLLPTSFEGTMIAYCKTI